MLNAPVPDLEAVLAERRAVVAELANRLEQVRARRDGLREDKRPDALLAVQGDSEARQRLARINEEIAALDAEADDLALAHETAAAEVERAAAAVTNARDAERKAKLAHYCKVVLGLDEEIDRALPVLDELVERHAAVLSVCVTLEPALMRQAGSHWRLRAAVPLDLAQRLNMEIIRPSERSSLHAIENRWLAPYLGEETDAEPEAA